MKYWAFISYSHADKAWGDWLHRAVETWRPPRSLVGRAGRDGPVTRKNLPVFRDREELPSGANLSDNINNALRESLYLIVICSPRSAASRWVNEEGRYFKALGREDRVLCLIVDGEPNASDKPESGLLECFPPAVRFRVGSDGALTARRTEPIAADARPTGDGRERAKLKLLAGLLGVNFDDLVQRDRRRPRWRRARLAALAMASAAAAVWWWLQPGTLRLQVRPFPQGTQLTVNGREQPLEQGSTELKLSAGRHDIAVRAPEYDDNLRSVTLERRQVQEITLEMHHEQGILDVEVDPDDARIEVDGRPFGSRIAELPFDSGDHLVRALHADRYERAARVVEHKGDTARVFLSLQPAVKEWSIERWDVQGGFVNVGDVDGDGVDDFVHNFIAEVAVISGRTGAFLHHIPTRDGNLRPFSGADLGGSVGRVALSSGTRNVRDASGAWLTDVLCIRGDSDGPLWRWTGPAPPVGNAMALAVGDLTSDGVSEVAVFSVADELHLLDGASGLLLRSLKFGVKEWSNAPYLARCPTAAGEGVFFCGVPVGGGLTYGWGTRTVHAGLLLVMDGQLAWQTDFSDVLAFCPANISGHGPVELALVDQRRWRVIDGTTGAIKFEGALPRADETRELTGFWFADLDGDGVAEWIMGFRPGVAEAEPLVAAVRLRDGAVLWKRDDLHPLSQQTVGNDGRLIRASDGGIIIRLEDALVSLDPKTGTTRWRQPIATGATSGFVSDAKSGANLYLGEVGRGIRVLGLDGSARWGVWFSREYSPLLALADARHPERVRVILNHHDGSEQEKCEIACVLPPSGEDWERRVIPPNPLPQTPRGGAPLMIPGPRPLVAHVTSEPPGIPNLVTDDAVTGVRVWQARDLFKPQTAVALGAWGVAREDAIATLGQIAGDLIGARTALFVLRARDGSRLAMVSIEPWGDFVTDAALTPLMVDGPSEFVGVRTSLLKPDGTPISGDVFAVSSAQTNMKWRRELAEPVALAVSPASTGKPSMVFVALRDGTIRALAGADGHDMWQSLPSLATRAPLLVKGQNGTLELVASRNDGKLIFLNAATGEIQQTLELSNSGQLGPGVAVGSAVYFPSSEYGTIAVDAVSRKELWRGAKGSAVRLRPCIAVHRDGSERLVVQCDEDGMVTALNEKTGAVVAEVRAGGKPATEIAWLPGTVDRPARVFVNCEDGVLRTRVAPER